VVEVLVDKLEEPESAFVCWRSSAGAKHTSLEDFAMSLNAGGGNFGRTFSTLTYSVVDMMAVFEEEADCGGGDDVAIRCRSNFCAKTPLSPGGFRVRLCASGLFRKGSDHRADNMPKSHAFDTT
jgi:hypothetical protein